MTLRFASTTTWPMSAGYAFPMRMMATTSP